MKRYAIVRVDRSCPLSDINIGNINIGNINVCKVSKSCQNCLFGDTKEQLVRKVAQALLIDQIERYRKAPNCDVNKTIIEHEYRICLEKAQFIVEFLGVE